MVPLSPVPVPLSPPLVPMSTPPVPMSPPPLVSGTHSPAMHTWLPGQLAP
jgi:hypothetical protein